MASQIITTKSLFGMRAVTQAKGKKIGKVRRFVFHPSEKRVIGFTVKRPDAALMFHRKDLFVGLNGFHVEDGQVVVHEDSDATDKGAIKALGVDWESCVIWVGMPALTQSGELLGYIDVVSFDRQTGAVQSFTTENGAASNAILGKRSVPARLIKGFKRGVGAAIAPVGEPDAAGDEAAETGAILVSDEVLELPVEGGAAAAAGKATAVVAHKAKKGAAKVKVSASQQAERAKPTAQKVAKATGEAVEAGSFAVGKQLGRASGMFSAFKEEFQKASKGEE